MDLARLIHDLSRPDAYPEPVEAVEIRQTHISVVFLAGSHAYKIKKPVDLGFLDFSSLEKRRHFCEEEVRLNRRLAASVYLGVVPITERDGRLCMEGPGEAVEWAVKMRRLPDEATLQQHVLGGDIAAEQIEALARKIATFHQQAASNEHIASFGKFDVITRNIHENLVYGERQVGRTVEAAVFARIKQLTERTLEHCRPLIEKRARPGVIRDTHGDLHLDHVYLFPQRSPPEDLVMVDCIEFNERYRYTDPVADMAFLAMDLAFHGRRDLARVFADSYFAATGDGEGRALLPLYTAYRAAVRAKVEGIKLLEKEVPAAEREQEALRATAHWLLALGELEEPRRRPCLVLIGGLPGTGKSTLARALADSAGFDIIRSDVVRKELAGIAEQDRGDSEFAQGIYSDAWSERTYAECLRRAEARLRESRRVIVDASFRRLKHRHLYLDAARRLAVPGLFLECRADPETVRRRLRERTNDVSDADWAIYLKSAQRWEEEPPATPPRHWIIAANATAPAILAQVEQVLKAEGLL